jgi:hypothetical protein
LLESICHFGSYFIMERNDEETFWVADRDKNRENVSQHMQAACSGVAGDKSPCFSSF